MCAVMCFENRDIIDRINADNGCRKMRPIGGDDGYCVTDVGENMSTGDDESLGIDKKSAS